MYFLMSHRPRQALGILRGVFLSHPQRLLLPSVASLKATVLIVLARPLSWVLGRSRLFLGCCQQLSHSARVLPTSHSCLPSVESMAGPRCSRHLPTAVPNMTLMNFAGTIQGVTSPISGLWVEMQCLCHMSLLQKRISVPTWGSSHPAPSH